MERLTKIVDGSIVFPSELVGVTLAPDNEIMHALLTRLAAYEDAMTLERAQELSQAEKAGRLAVLPGEEYCWRVRGDIALGLILANCRRAQEEAGEATP